ncbi:Mpv17_PMP22 domain-containing protein [Cephalotus follicularis]|uniref:Mpv17_PMP22 domain-containing protein n=1 Tax=Cephalotus follicularis TaxID=3775 RepID=A0A1Q3CPT2_CEPFO|nr:Mpv17_PMP22 domain-containing protein [Cephalotus follicularis]
MGPNPVSLTRKSPLLYRFAVLSFKPTPYLGQRVQIPAKAVQISGFRTSSSSSSSSSYCYYSLSYSFLRSGFKQGHSKVGHNFFRLPSMADGGVGGDGGFGGTGDGKSGGRSEGGGDGGNKWSLLSWYLARLEKYPVLTKAVTSALLTLIGDLICQLVIDQVPSLDLKRTFQFTLLGLVLVGPTLHFWYLYLSKLVTMPGASGAFLRLILDQFLFSPMFIGIFLSTLMTLEGKPSQVVPKLQQEWFSAVLANWQLWIPFQFLNFRFVPQQLQVLAANVVALVWNVILSFKAHKEILPK